MNKKITDYLQLKVEEKTLKEKLNKLKDEILEDEDFTKVESEGITITKQSRKTYKYLGEVSILAKKYPKFVEMKPKNLKDLYKVDTEGTERNISETLVVKGI